MGACGTCISKPKDPHSPNSNTTTSRSSQATLVPKIITDEMPDPNGVYKSQKDPTSKSKTYTPIPSDIPIEFTNDEHFLLASDHCNLDHCSAMKRFKYILDHHDEELETYGAYEFINNHLKKYNNIHLLNDYHHLVFVHEYEFEDIYNILTDNNLGKCNLNKCTSFTRNHRDRSSSATIANKMQYEKFTKNNKNDTKQLNTIQIIDQIHCYFLHTFDCHYKLNKEEQLKLEEKIDELYHKETINNESNDGKEIELSGSRNDNDDDEFPVAERVRAYSQHRDSLVNQEMQRPGLRDRFSVTQRVKNKKLKFCQLERIVSVDGTVNEDDNDETFTIHRFGSRRNMSIRDMKMDDIKEEKYDGKRGSDRDRKQSKIKIEIKDNDDDDDVYGKENDIVYSFGVRFVYDEQDKNNQWYVKPKWKTLKEEQISNSYDGFDIEQWIELYEKAKDFRKTRRIKQECKFKDYGDAITTHRNKKRKAKDTMSIQHLISIMLYCNFDQLQGVFSASYRKDKKESNQDLINKHSEWHQLGKYLREVVEVFGTKISTEEKRLRKLGGRGRGDFCLDKSGKLKFYHGINQEMVFVSTSAKICGPLSTSSEPFVAVNFAGAEGLLLELSGSNARFFDCCGISDYSNEKEKFFLGGYDALLIETVINPRTKDYRPYIRAINIISCLFNGQQYFSNSSKPFSDRTCKLVYTLLFYKKLKNDENANIEKIEPYVQRLFNHYAKNVTEINVDWPLMNMSCDKFQLNAKGFKFIKHKICMDTFDCIKMNRIISLFKHLQIIQLNYIKLTKKVLDYILAQLKKHQHGNVYENVKKIIIYQPSQKRGLTIPDALALYADKYRLEIGWKLYVHDKESYNDLSICRLTT